MLLFFKEKSRGAAVDIAIDPAVRSNMTKILMNFNVLTEILDI